MSARVRHIEQSRVRAYIVTTFEWNATVNRIGGQDTWQVWVQKSCTFLYMNSCLKYLHQYSIMEIKNRSYLGFILKNTKNANKQNAQCENRALPENLTYVHALLYTIILFVELFLCHLKCHPNNLHFQSPSYKIDKEITKKYTGVCTPVCHVFCAPVQFRRVPFEGRTTYAHPQLPPSTMKLNVDADAYQSLFLGLNLSGPLKRKVTEPISHHPRTFGTLNFAHCRSYVRY